MKNPVFIFAVVFGFAFLNNGCSPPTAGEVVGTYTYSNEVVVDKIDLKPDGTFLEVLKYSEGRTWMITNTWTLRNWAIQLGEGYHFFDDDKMAADLKPVVLKEPERVSMCTFEWEGNGLSRYDHNFLWEKAAR